MSSLTSVREFARPATASYTFARATALLAGAVAAGVERVMTRMEVARSRRQLAQLDDRLLRDIGIDRATARLEADKGFRI